MADNWEPNQVFYDQLSKATLLKLLAEGCGNDAAENCQTMKRSDLALTVNERLAGRRILPPALRPSALPDAADSESHAACRHKSTERRVGNGCVRTCVSRWSPYR